MKEILGKIKDKASQLSELLNPVNIWAGASKKLRIVIVAVISLIILLVATLTILNIIKNNKAKEEIDGIINNLFITDMSYSDVYGSLMNETINIDDVKIYPIDWRHKLGLSNKREDLSGLYLDIGKISIPNIVYEDDLIQDVKLYLYDVKPSEIMLSRINDEISKIWSSQGISYTIDASIHITYYKKTESLDVNIDIDGGDAMAIKIKTRFSDTYEAYKSLKDNLTRYFVGNSKIAEVIGSEKEIGLSEILGSASINKIDIIMLDKNFTKNTLEVLSDSRGLDFEDYQVSLKDSLEKSRSRFDAYDASNAVKIIDVLIEMVMNGSTRVSLEVRPESSKRLYDLITRINNGEAMNPDTTGFSFKTSKNKIN